MKYKYTEALMCYLALLISVSALAGKETGGGDPIAQDLVSKAETALSLLTADPNQFPMIDLNILQAKIASVHVIATDDILRANDPEPKTAVNSPLTNEIYVNRAAWSRISNARAQTALALHEYLGIMGIEHDTYPYSAKLLNLSPREIDSGRFGVIDSKDVYQDVAANNSDLQVQGDLQSLTITTTEVSTSQGASRQYSCSDENAQGCNMIENDPGVPNMANLWTLSVLPNGCLFVHRTCDPFPYEDLDPVTRVAWGSTYCPHYPDLAINYCPMVSSPTVSPTPDPVFSPNPITTIPPPIVIPVPSPGAGPVSLPSLEVEGKAGSGQTNEFLLEKCDWSTITQSVPKGGCVFFNSGKLNESVHVDPGYYKVLYSNSEYPAVIRISSQDKIKLKLTGLKIQKSQSAAKFQVFVDYSQVTEQNRLIRSIWQDNLRSDAATNYATSLQNCIRLGCIEKPSLLVENYMEAWLNSRSPQDLLGKGINFMPDGLFSYSLNMTTDSAGPTHFDSFSRDWIGENQRQAPGEVAVFPGIYGVQFTYPDGRTAIQTAIKVQ